MRGERGIIFVRCARQCPHNPTGKDYEREPYLFEFASRYGRRLV